MVHKYLRQRRVSSARPLRWTLALGLAVGLAGCATVPPPNGSMNMAQEQLQAAREAGAADYAPVDLDYAQSRFQQAQSAMSRHKYEDAGRLADEARADAELARAKARLGAARAQIQSKTEENARLRQQIDQAHPPVDTSAPAQGFAPVNSPAPTEQPDQVLPQPGDAAAPAPSSTTPTNPAGGFQSLPPANNQGGQP